MNRVTFTLTKPDGTVEAQDGALCATTVDENFVAWCWEAHFFIPGNATPNPLRYEIEVKSDSISDILTGAVFVPIG